MFVTFSQQVASAEPIPDGPDLDRLWMFGPDFCDLWLFLLIPTAPKTNMESENHHEMTSKLIFKTSI